MAEREAEMLSELGHPIEFVLGSIFRKPVALVLGEPQLFGNGMPVEADRHADTPCDDLHAAAVEIDATKLGVSVGRDADVAGGSDLKIELVVGPDGEKLPAVRLVLGQIVVDHYRFGRVVEVVFDLLDLRNPGKLGNVEGAIVEGQSVRSIELG